MSVDPKSLKIVHYPAPVLLKVAQPIEQVNAQVVAVAEKMLQLMHEAKGVGLAAPQVGLSWCLFVANSTQELGDDKVYINPTLSHATRLTASLEEGCLSLPDVKAHISRPQGITITAWDTTNQKFEQTRDDLWARVWQHEYDHLQGKLILDKMTPIDKMANRRIIKALIAEAQ